MATSNWGGGGLVSHGARILFPISLPPLGDTPAARTNRVKCRARLEVQQPDFGPLRAANPNSNPNPPDGKKGGWSALPPTLHRLRLQVGEKGFRFFPATPAAVLPPYLY